MKSIAFGRYAFVLLLLVAGCHKLLGDFTVVEGDEATCTSGAVQCVGTVLQSCNSEGNGWQNAAVCASETLCDQTAGACLTPVCASGERRCLGADVQLCNGTRDGWTTIETCATAGHCSTQPGGCMEVPCQPGEFQCSGAVPQVCKSDQSGWTESEPCLSAALCNPLTGECDTAACDPGEFQCVGAELQTCSTTLDSWTTIQVCASEPLCDELVGMCSQVGCTTAGVFRCGDGGVLERCNDDLTAWTSVAVCESVAHCDTISGMCTVEPCVPGVYQCSGATLEVCNADRTGRDPVETCETAGLCQATLSQSAITCQPPLCAEGEFACAGAQPQICKADRTGFRENGTPCPTPELCNVVTGGCDPPNCDSGEARCMGAQPELCNPGRTAFEPAGPACGSSALCDAERGACRDAACVAGQKRCDPGDPTRLQLCNDTLDGWNDCDICETAGLCDASVGVLTCDATSCQAPSCALTDLWCGGNDGRSLYQCPPSRINTQAQVLEVCATAGLCQQTHDQGNTTCNEPTCQLTDLWCGGTGDRTLYKCPPSRINSEPTLLDTCETSGLCDQAHAQNAMTCPEPACATGQTQCAGTGNRTLRMCRSDRTSYMDCDTCDSSTLCTESLSITTCNTSACRSCSAGQKQCTGSQLQVCNANRDGWSLLELCDSSALCTNSLTPASQMTCDVCVAGSRDCNGVQPRLCSDAGAWAADGAACDAATLCDSATGTCICSLMATRCHATSGNFEECQSTGWVETAVCSMGCDATTGCL